MSNIGKTNDFSTTPPVRGRRKRNGGIPKRKGMGNNQGTPSSVNVSIMRCERKPIINAHQTIDISTIRTPCILSRINQASEPNKMMPIIECEIYL